MQRRILLSLLLVCAVVSAVVAVDKLRGVKQSSQNIFQGEYIECDGGKKVPTSRVNDDFCDCVDGFDEPGTSACPSGRFFCSNKGYRGSYIPSSWVDDGRCDCCDGSDELNTKCPNVCAEAAKLHMVSVEKEIQLQENGLRTRGQYVAEAKRDIEAKHKEILEKEAQITALESRLASFEAVKKAAEDKHNAARVAAEQIHKETFQKAVDAENAANGNDEAKFDDEKMRTAIEEDESVKPLKSELDKAEADVNSARTEKDNVQRDLEKLRKFVSSDFGPDSALHAIHSKTFDWSDREYTYKLHGYVDVTQTKPGHSSNLGRYKGFDPADPNIMIYDSGDRCWGAPDRSSKVYLVCGDENKVVDVKEPNKCEYALTFQTPAACSQAALDALKLGE